MSTAHDAIVLAGGRASRLGGDKPNVHVAGRRLLDHVLAATTAARRVVVVGPDDLLSPGAAEPSARLSVTREEPPFGGPVAGLAAGLARLAEPDQGAPGTDGPCAPVLLLACDIPFAARLAPALLDAWAGVTTGGHGRPDGVCVEAAGRAQWLVGVYDPAALRRALTALTATRPLDGASMKQVVRHLELVTIDDPQGLSTDVDTWHDVERIDIRTAGDRRFATGDPR